MSHSIQGPVVMQCPGSKVCLGKKVKDWNVRFKNVIVVISVGASSNLLLWLICDFGFFCSECVYYFVQRIFKISKCSLQKKIKKKRVPPFSLSHSVKGPAGDAEAWGRPEISSGGWLGPRWERHTHLGSWHLLGCPCSCWEGTWRVSQSPSPART